MTSDVQRLVTAIALSLVASAIPARVDAQTCGPNDVVPWWPRFVANVGGNTLTATERAAVEARLGAVEALMRKTPYATPRGFAVRPTFGYHEITSRTELYPHMFALGIF